jgi:hypothetical protein
MGEPWWWYVLVGIAAGAALAVLAGHYRPARHRPSLTAFSRRHQGRLWEARCVECSATYRSVEADACAYWSAAHHLDRHRGR